MKKFKNEIITIGIITILFSMYKITHNSFSFDTDLLMLRPKEIMDSWIGLSRFGLVFIKYIFNLYNDVDIRLFNVITYVNVFIYSLIFMYFLNIDEKKGYFVNILSIIIVITSPIMLEQYNFTLQSPEVSFGMILMMISFVITYKFLKNNKIKYIIILLLLLPVCYGIYQSFVNLYILGVLISLYKIKENYKKNILKTIIIFLISLMIYYIISKIAINIFNIEKSSYLSSQILWFESAQRALTVVLKTIIKVIVGYKNILNLGFLICIFIVSLYIRQNKKVTIDVLLLILIILSPLFLNIITGSLLTYRSLFTMPFMMSFIFYEFFDLRKYIKVLLIMLIFSQVTHCFLLLVSDYKRYLNDVKISKKIYKDCRADKNTKIYIYGIEKSEENIDVFKGEVMGYSFYEWTYDGKTVSDDRVQNFMNIHNMKYIRGNILEQNIDFEEEYPNKGYIIKKENNCYVNLGN